MKDKYLVSGIWCLLFVCLLMSGICQKVYASEEIYVCAAASLTDVMAEVAQDFEAQDGQKIYLNFAGSNTLRVQIMRGAPCDIFVSADRMNVDKLILEGIVKNGSEKKLLSNRLVVVSFFKNETRFDSLNDLARDDGKFLSLADPDSVPAGIYAKQALMNFGVWEDVKNRVASAMDVRAALVQVERNNAEYGIVYKTDAQISDKIKVVYEIPQKYHDPIEYVAVLMKPADAQSAAFFRFLSDKSAIQVFRRYGFFNQIPDTGNQ